MLQYDAPRPFAVGRHWVLMLRFGLDGCLLVVHPCERLHAAKLFLWLSITAAHCD